MSHKMKSYWFIIHFSILNLLLTVSQGTVHCVCDTPFHPCPKTHTYTHSHTPPMSNIPFPWLDFHSWLITVRYGCYFISHSWQVSPVLLFVSSSVVDTLCLKCFKWRSTGLTSWLRHQKCSAGVRDCTLSYFHFGIRTDALKQEIR